ncbi:MAG: hypothetical protein WCG98_01800 [bacterium]
MKKGTEDAQQEEVIILNTKKPRFQVLSPEALAIVKEKCQQAIKNNQLSVLPADAEVQQAFDTLRADYLNEELPLPERAITNITITDDEFRESSKIITDKILQLICAEDRAENLIGLYIWRAGIVPFMASCIDAGIQKHEHIGMNRVENNPTQQEIYLPLTVDAKILSKNSKILLADPMFAT